MSNWSMLRFYTVFKCDFSNMNSNRRNPSIAAQLLLEEASGKCLPLAVGFGRGYKQAWSA